MKENTDIDSWLNESMQHLGRIKQRLSSYMKDKKDGEKE